MKKRNDHVRPFSSSRLAPTLTLGLCLALSCRMDPPQSLDGEAELEPVDAARPDRATDQAALAVRDDGGPDDAGVYDRAPGATPDASAEIGAGGDDALATVKDAPIAQSQDVPADDGRPREAASAEAAADVTVAPADAGKPPCGLPGQLCCPGDTCVNGGCCAAGSVLAPRCVGSGQGCLLPDGTSGGVCGNGICSGCGSILNQSCCQGDVCTGDGLVCGGGLCRACGAPGGPCCSGGDGPRCGPGAFCRGEACQACGGPNQPCCPGRSCASGGCCVRTASDERCVASGGACPAREGTCQSGRCSGCGGLDQPCCAGGSCHDGTSACLSGRCTPCGRLAEPACQASVCSAGDCINSDGVCVGGGAFCGQGAGTCTTQGACVRDDVTCGGLKQACCALGGSAGPFCAKPGTTCLERVCVECGGLGQPCCNGDECRSGSCAANRVCR